MSQIEASKAYLCPNTSDSLQLSIAQWPTHTWWNGSTSNAVWVSEPGTYFVTVGTGFGHSIQLQYTVELAAVDVFEAITTPVLCYGDSTGTIEIMDMTSNQVVANLNGVPAGAYSIPITVTEGCVILQDVTVTEPHPFFVQVDSINNACAGLSNGSALVIGVDGVSPYAGFDEFGFLHLNNLPVGNYSQTVMDANGCPASYSFDIAEIPSATIQINSPNWVCPNENVVFSATVNGIGTNYFWDVLAPGALLGAGEYVTAVVDSLGCSTSVSIHIQELQSPTIQATVVSESVFGLGSITLEILGNSAPYIATWQSGFVGLNYTNLSQGNYPVSIAYGLGCTVDTSFTVLFDFVEEQNFPSEFNFDWKEGGLKYTGAERIFDIEVYNAIGELILTRSSLGTNECIPLNLAPQVIFISSSKGTFKTKVVLP